MITFPRCLDLALRPTPLEPLERLTEELGGPELWIKRDDLTGCLLSGNKVRKLGYVLADVLNREADVLITSGAVQSNHCRATAVAGARLGLKVHLVLRGDRPEQYDGNLFLDELCGAEVTFIEGSAYKATSGEEVDRLAAEYRALGHRPYVIPVGASDALGLWGYISCMDELQEQAHKQRAVPDHIVCATGSGGTQAGLIAGNLLFGLGAKVSGINVAHDGDYFRKKIGADLDEWSQRGDARWDGASMTVNMIEDYLGDGYGKAGPEVFELIKWVARREGVLLDPVYTGKAFYGLVNEIRQGRYGRQERICFLHSGGVFGAMARRADFHRN